MAATLEEILGDPRMAEMDREDRNSVLDGYFEEQIEAGNADQFDQFVLKASLQLEEDFAGESERRKPFLQERYDLIADYHNRTSGLAPAVRQSEMMNLMHRLRRVDRKEAGDVGNMGKVFESAQTVLLGDPDEVKKSKSEAGIWKGHILGTLAEGVEGLGAKAEDTTLGERIFLPAALFNDFKNPREIRAEDAEVAREELSRLGFKDERQQEVIDKIRDDLKGFKDSDEKYRVNFFGEVDYNPEALLKDGADSVIEEVSKDDSLPERVKRRAIAKAKDDESTAIDTFLDSLSSREVTRLKGLPGETWQEKISEWIDKEENKSGASKILAGTYHKLRSSSVRLVGGTSGIFGKRDGFLGSDTMSTAAQMLDDSAARLDASGGQEFTSDLFALFPDLLLARGAGTAARGATAWTNLMRAKKAAGGASAIGSAQLARMASMEKTAARIGVSVGSGYGAGARTVASAQQQGFSDDEARMFGLRQFLITSLVTGAGSGSGTESVLTGEFKKTAVKGLKQFAGDFLKHSLKEGVEEFADELISGVMVEMQMNPKMGVTEVVDQALHAFYLGAAMGGGINVLAKGAQGVAGAFGDPSVDELLSETSQTLQDNGIDVAQAKADAQGIPVPVGPTGAEGEVGVEATQETATAEDSVPANEDAPPTSETTATSEEGAEGETGTTGEAGPETVSLGSGVSVSVASDGPGVVEQVFGSPAEGRRVNPALDASQISVKTDKKSGEKRVFFGKQETDRIFNTESGKFETKAPKSDFAFKSSTTSQKIPKKKPEESTANSPSPVRERFIAGNPRNQAALEGGGEADLQALDSGGEVEFAEGQEASQFDAATGKVTINRGARPANLRQIQIPRTAAERAAATTDQPVEALVSAIPEASLDGVLNNQTGADAPTKAKLLVAEALFGNSKAVEALSKAGAENPGVAQEIQNVISAIQRAPLGPNSKTATDDRVNALRRRLAKSGINLGSAAPVSDPIKPRRSGIFRAVSSRFEALRKDPVNAKGNRNPQKAIIESGSDVNTIKESLEVGSVIEVENEAGTDQDVWVVASTQRLFDGRTRHYLKKAGKETKSLEGKLRSLFTGPGQKDQVKALLQKIRNNGGNPTSEIIGEIRQLVRSTFGEVAGESYVEDKLRFVDDETAELPGRPAYVNFRFDEAGQADPEIHVNEQSLYNRIRAIAGKINGKNPLTEDSAAEDTAALYSTIAYEEVAHEHALRELNQSDIINTTRDWVELAQDDIRARNLLVRWYRYTKGDIGRAQNQSNSELWKELRDMASADGDADAEAYNRTLLQVGHEAIAGFLQLTKTGNSTLSMNAALEGWLQGFVVGDPLAERAPDKKGNVTRFSVMRRLVEMAQRVVESVTRFFRAHRDLRALPPKLESMVNQLDQILEAGGVKAPDFFSIQSRALDRGSQSLNNTLNALKSDFSLSEVQRGLQNSLRAIAVRIGAQPHEVIQYDVTAGRVALRLTDQAEDSLTEDEVAEVSESLATINDSGRPSIIARNGAESQDVQALFRRMTGRSMNDMIGRTPEESQAIIDDVQTTVLRDIERQTGIAASDVLSEISELYRNSVQDIRSERIEQLNQQIDPFNPAEVPGPSGETFRAAQERIERAQEDLSRIPILTEFESDQTALERRNAELELAEALESFSNLQELALNPTTELGQSPAGRGLQRQRSQQNRVLAQIREILTANPLEQMRTPEQMLTAFRRHRDDAEANGSVSLFDRVIRDRAQLSRDGETGIFGGRTEEERFDKAEGVIRAFDRASKLMRAASDLQRVGEEMDYALIGGRLPSRMRTTKGRFEADVWRAVNLVDGDRRSIPVGVGQMTRARVNFASPQEMLEHVDSSTLVDELLASEQEPVLEPSPELTAMIEELSNEDTSDARKSEIAALLSEGRFKEEMDAKGLQMVFGSRGSGQLGVTFTPGVPFDVQAGMADGTERRQVVERMSRQVESSEEAAYSLLGYSPTLGRNGQTADEVKRSMRRNASAAAQQLTEESVERLFRGDGELSNDVMVTGGFPVHRRTEAEVDLKGRETVLAEFLDVKQDVINLPDWEVPATTEQFNPANQLNTIIENGLVANTLLEINQFVELMEYGSSSHESAVMSHDEGLTPAGFAYQLVSAPFTAFLARTKGLSIGNVTFEQALVDSVPDEITKERVRKVYNSLMEGIQNSPNWRFARSQGVGQVFNQFVNLRRQAKQVSTVYNETLNTLRSRRIVDQIDRASKRAAPVGERDFLFPLDIKLGERLFHQSKIFADTRRRGNNPEMEKGVTPIQPDRAGYILQLYNLRETSSEQLRLKSHVTRVDAEGNVEESTPVVMREGEDPSLDRYGLPEERLNELLSPEFKGDPVQRFLQGEKDEQVRLSSLRTVALMELFGFDWNRARNFVNQPEYARAVPTPEGDLEYDYNFEKLDDWIKGELSRLHAEERRRGIVTSVESRRNPGVGTGVVDRRLEEMVSEFGVQSGASIEATEFRTNAARQALSEGSFPDEDTLNPTGRALVSVLSAGGEVYTTIREDISNQDKATVDMESRHQQSSWKTLTHIASLIPGLRIVHGNAHHDLARGEDSVPSVAFVPSQNDPILVLPYRYSQMISTQDIGRAMREIVTWLGESAEVDIDSMARSILQPIAEMHSEIGFERVAQTFRNWVNQHVPDLDLNVEQRVDLLAEQHAAAVVGEIDKIFRKSEETVGPDASTTTWAHPRNAEDALTQRIDSRLAADVIAGFLSNDNLKRILALASIGTDQMVNVASPAWDILGDVIGADLMVMSEDNVLPNYLREIATEFNEISLSEDETVGGTGVPTATIEHYRQYVENELDPVLNISNTSVVYSSMLMEDGVKSASDILINAVDSMRPAEDVQPTGLVPAPTDGSLTEYEARQIRALFSDADIAAMMGMDSDVAGRLSDGVSIQEMIALDAEVANFLRQRFAELATTIEEGEADPLIARFGYNSASDHLFGRDPRSTRFRRNNIESGKLGAVLKMPLEENADGERVLDVGGKDLEAMLRDAGLPTEIPQEHGEPINIVERARARQERERRAANEILAARRLEVQTQTTRQEQLQGARESLQRIKEELLNAPTAENFVGQMRQAGIYDVLNGDEQGRDILDRFMQTFFGDTETVVDSIAEHLVTLDERAESRAGQLGFSGPAIPALVGLHELSGYENENAVSPFQRKAEKIRGVSQALTHRLGGSIDFASRKLQNALRELDMLESTQNVGIALEAAVDQTGADSARISERKAFSIRQKMTDISRSVDNWVDAAIKVAESQFGPDIISRQGLRFPRETDEFANLRRRIENGGWQSDLQTFVANLESLTDSEVVAERIQNLALAETLEMFENQGTFVPAALTVNGASDAHLSLPEIVETPNGERSLFELVRRSRNIFSEAQNTQSPDPRKARVNWLFRQINPHFGRQIDAAVSQLEVGIDRALDSVKEDFVEGQGNAAMIIEAAENLGEFGGLTREQMTRVVIKSIDQAIESQMMITDANLRGIAQENAQAMVRNHGVRNYVSSFRDNEANTVRIDGSPEEVELTQNVLTDIAKMHSDYYREEFQRRTDLQGLERIEAATALADDKIEAAEQFRQAMTDVTGQQYRISDTVLIPEDAEARVRRIMERQNGREVTDEEVAKAVEELKLFTTVGAMDDRSDFPTTDPEEAIFRTVAQDAMANMRAAGHLSYPSLTAAEKAFGEEVFGEDKLGNVVEMHTEMLTFISKFHGFMQDNSDEDIAMELSSDPLVVEEIGNLRSRVDNFVENTFRNPVSGEMPTSREGNFSEVLSLYSDTKSLRMAMRHAVSLEAGFLDTRSLDTSHFKGLLHHDSKIRSVFARDLQGQSIAQGVTGLLEFGPGTSSFGRTGSFSMQDAMNEAIANAAPKRKGPSIGQPRVDMEKTSEGYFGAAIISHLSATNGKRNIQERAETLLQIFEAADTNMGSALARSNTGSALSRARDNFFETDQKLLRDRKVYAEIRDQFAPTLREIASGQIDAVDALTAIQGLMSEEAAEYAGFLDNMFGYVSKVFQAQGQLVPPQELEDGIGWVSGTKHISTLAKVPFRWQRFFLSEQSNEANQTSIADKVSMRGAAWLKNPEAEFSPEVFQILDVNGLRGPSQVLADMAYRMNVMPAVALTQAFTGELTQPNQGGRRRFQMNYTPNSSKPLGENRGALGFLFHDRDDRPEGDYSRRTFAENMVGVGTSLGWMTQEIILKDIDRQNPNNLVQNAIEDVGQVGMATTLISLRQLVFQTVPAIIGYGIFRDGLFRNSKVIAPFLKLARSAVANTGKAVASKIPGVDINTDASFAKEVEKFVKKHSFSLYLRSAEGIELFQDLLQDARPRARSLTGNRVKNQVIAITDGGLSVNKRLMKFGLQKTIAAGEKVAIRAIFMSELAKLVGQRVGEPVSINQLLSGEMDSRLSPELLEQARIISIDILAQSDTSKKADLFQRGETITGEVARGVFATFANHLLSTSANSYAGWKMMRNGQDKATRAEGARLIRTNIAQNVLYQMMNLGFNSTVLLSLAQALGMLNEEEKKEALLWAYGLEDGPENRYKTARGWLTQFAAGSRRPFGYRYSKGEWEEDTLERDWANFGIRAFGEVVNQTPGIGLVTSTTLGGSVYDWSMKQVVGGATGVSFNNGERAGITIGNEPIAAEEASFGEHVKKLPTSAPYYISQFLKNHTGDRSYLFQGINHLTEPLFHYSNAEKDAEVSKGATLKMAGAYLPWLPRESRYDLWKGFDEDTGARIWHSQWKPKAKSKSRSRAKRRSR